MADDLDTVKQVIRSLLITSKHGVTLKEFLKDYRENEGCILPYKQFGSSSPQEFLQKLRDTVHVSTTGSGEVVLAPAITADVKHIDKLVRTQKTAPSKRGARAKFPVRRTVRTTTALSVPKRPANIVQAFKKKQADGTLPAMTSAAQTLAAKNGSNFGNERAAGISSNESTCSSGDFEELIWEEESTNEKSDCHASIENEISSLRLANSVPTSHWNAAAAPLTGAPEAALADNKVDYVHTSSDAIKASGTSSSGIQETATAAKDGDWFRKLFPSSQGDTGASKQQGIFSCPQLPTQPSIVNQGFTYQASALSWQVNAAPSMMYFPRPSFPRMPFYMNTALQYNQGHTFLAPNKGYPAVGNTFTAQQSVKGLASNDPRLNAYAPPYVPKGTLIADSTTSEVPKDTPPRVESKDEGMPAEIVSGITDLLRGRSEGVCVKDLPGLYEEKVGKHAFFEEKRDPVQLVKEIIERVPMVSVSSLVGGDFTVKILETDVEKEDDDDAATKIPAEVASGVGLLLRRHPEGITTHDLPRLYRSEVGEHSFFSDSSPSTLAYALVASIPSVTVESLGGGRFLLKTVEAEGNEEESKIVLVEETASKEESGSYRKLAIPAHTFSVAVGEVYSPDEFYVLVRGEGTTGALERLMKDLDAFYATECPLSYAVKREDVRPGFPCAAPYVLNGRPHWHRAQVLSRKISKVWISYVDYGTATQMDCEKLRRLCPRFMELPVQGIKVGLEGVEPKGSKNWPQEAKERFLKLMRDNELQCRVEEQRVDVTKVSLWRNANSRLRSIADILVEEGYAEGTRPKCRLREWHVAPCYLKKGSQLDVIMWKGIYYVTGWNVSELFGWPPTRVEELLAEKQIVFNIQIVTKTEQPDLFAEIAREQGQGGEETVTLFKLASVLDLLNLFGHPSRTIRKEIEDILCGEWRSTAANQPSVNEESSTDEEDCEAMENKLRNKLQMLQEEQRDLRMQAYGGDRSITEEELQFLEDKVQSTQKILDMVKAQRSCVRRKKRANTGGTASGGDCALAPALQTKLMQLLSARKC